MPQGLQIFSDSGKVILDVESIGSMILGIFSTGTTKGKYTDEKIMNRKVWIVIATPPEANSYGNVLPAIFSQDGNTISWEFHSIDGGNATDLPFYYGV